MSWAPIFNDGITYVDAASMLLIVAILVAVFITVGQEVEIVKMRVMNVITKLNAVVVLVIVAAVVGVLVVAVGFVVVAVVPR